MIDDPADAIAQLEHGDLDLVFRVPPGDFDRLAARGKLELISAPTPGATKLVFATDREPWSSVSVRQAFAYAIDRRAIADQHFHGRASVLLNHPGFTVYEDINRYEYDPRKAVELLESGGYNNEPFRLMFNASGQQVSGIVPLIEAHLEAIGINVELMSMDPGVMRHWIGNERSFWDGYMSEVGREAISPGMSADWYSTAPAVASGYTNPRVLQLFAEGRSSADPAKRDAAYHELALLLNRELPMLHLVAPHEIVAAREGLGGGFDIHFDTHQTFTDIETWQWEPDRARPARASPSVSSVR
jgi:peptide/nickel transport system substrate-binding protein